MLELVRWVEAHLRNRLHFVVISGARSSLLSVSSNDKISNVKGKKNPPYTINTRYAIKKSGVPPSLNTEVLIYPAF